MLEKLAITLLFFGKMRSACFVARLVKKYKWEATRMLTGGKPSKSLWQTAIDMLLSEVTNVNDDPFLEII
jgi:hypothetical protein